MIRSNIITGFNKPSRVLESPYFEFYSRFCQDCLEAERIIIIGYSFSDIHVNKGIENAYNTSKDLKIEVITQKGSDLFEHHDWIPSKHLCEPSFDLDIEYSYLNIVSNLNDLNKITVYHKGFENYLKDKQWKRNK